MASLYASLCNNSLPLGIVIEDVWNNVMTLAPEADI